MKARERGHTDLGKHLRLEQPQSRPVSKSSVMAGCIGSIGSIGVIGPLAAAARPYASVTPTQDDEAVGLFRKPL